MAQTNDEDKKGKTGCFIVTFLLILSGLPAALSHEDSVRTLGIIPMVIIGIIVAYHVAKAVSDF